MTNGQAINEGHFRPLQAPVQFGLFPYPPPSLQDELFVMIWQPEIEAQSYWMRQTHIFKLIHWDN